MNTTSATAVATELVEAFGRFGPAYMKWLGAGIEGTTYARMRLLKALQVHGPQIMTVLSDWLAVTPRNVTVLVDGLEAEGLVRRVPHPEDRRATIVELTDDGEAVITAAHAQHTERAAALFSSLDENDQAALLVLIRRLTEQLVATGADEGCAVHLPR
jgi:DNA-binding MarR family transcriptional regulator